MNSLVGRGVGEAPELPLSRKLGDSLEPEQRQPEETTGTAVPVERRRCLVIVLLRALSA
jgi:hypothetical protein